MGKLSSMFHYLQKKIKLSLNLETFTNKKNNLIQWIEKHPWKTLIISYFVVLVGKIIITQIYLDPSTLMDGFLYMKMGGSFFENGSFSVYGEPTHKYPPLYPIFISSAYIFKDTTMIFRIIRVLSAFYSTLIIFPTFLIAKEFLNTKKSLLVAVLVSSLAAIVVWVFNIVSECLYYTLFLFTCFFLYKSVFELGHLFKILSGLFIGLCFLTRYTTVVFIPVVLLFFIIVYLYEKNCPRLNAIMNALKNWCITSFIAGFVILPWLIRNGNLFGYNVVGIFGIGYKGEIMKVPGTIKEATKEATNTVYLIDLLTQFLINHAIIILACGIIFFILSIWIAYYSFRNKTKRIFALTVLTFLLTESLAIITTIHNGSWGTWRLHGRYIEPVFPLFIILGFMGLEKIKHLQHKIVYLTLIVSLPITLLLANTWGHMGGMISVSYIGVIQNLPMYLNKFLGTTINSSFFDNYKVIIFLLILLLFLIFFLMIKYKVSKKMLLVISCGLILSSTIISCVGYVARDLYTSKSELYDFGNWLNEKFSGSNDIIFFDENIGEAIYPLAAWINTPILKGHWNETNSNSGIKYLITNRIYNYAVEHSAMISSPLDGEILGRRDWQVRIYVYNLGVD